MKIFRPVAVSGICLGLSTLCFATEKELQRAQLPPAVEKALQSQLDGATIKGFSTEVEGGKRLYEAELIVRGHSKDISFLVNGDIAEIEEEVAMDALPPQVKTALNARANGATIEKVESLTKRGKLVAYEASARRSSSKKTEFQVGPNGETLKRME